PVNGDVIVAAGRVVILSEVTGSVHVLAGDVIIDGDIGGSVMAAGSTFTLAADVGHAVRVAAAEVRIQRGTIAGDLVVAASDLEQSEPNTVRGEVLLRATTA